MPRVAAFPIPLGNRGIVLNAPTGSRQDDRYLGSLI